MSAARYLIDTSALFTIHRSEYREQWADAVSAGLITLCPVVELEFLYSARSLSDRLRLQRLLAATYPWQSMPDRVFARATEVQQLLTERGQHRSADAIDLLIAATAESARLVVLTADADFRAVAGVTGQPIRFISD